MAALAAAGARLPLAAEDVEAPHHAIQRICEPNAAVFVDRQTAGSNGGRTVANAKASSQRVPIEVEQAHVRTTHVAPDVQNARA